VTPKHRIPRKVSRKVENIMYGTSETGGLSEIVGDLAKAVAVQSGIPALEDGLYDEVMTKIREILLSHLAG